MDRFWKSPVAVEPKPETLAAMQAETEEEEEEEATEADAAGVSPNP